MLQFTIDSSRCTRCGACAADCPAVIITMSGDLPAIAPEKEQNCYRCQHCLAVCPTGALSICGVAPASCAPLADAFPDADRLETLIRGRRSVRRYRQENLELSQLQRLLDVAWQAPTGKNARQVLFTVVDDIEKIARLRADVMEGLAKLMRDGKLPPQLEYFGGFVTLWEKKRVDVLFRGAPHLLITSTPRTVASPAQDCLIAMSYFELFAQTQGIGTVWNGLVTWALFDILSGMRERLGIPEDHQIGYSMSFGLPAVDYARAVQHGPAAVNRVSL